MLLKAKLEQMEAQLNDAMKSLVKAQREVKYSKEMTKKLQKEFEAQESKDYYLQIIGKGGEDAQYSVFLDIV